MSSVYEALKKAARERLAQTGVPPAEGSSQRADRDSQDAVLNPAMQAANAAALPLANGETSQPRLVVGEAAGSRLADEFHVLATHFQRLTAERHQRVIEVTSASAREGKSFVTLNLGLSLARVGCRVILVGADLRAPSLHQAFNLTPLDGLLGYLLQQTGFSRCLYQTATPGLTLIPAGGASFSGAELFAGSRMQEFITAARTAEPEGYVLLDCPALLGAPEGQIIARAVDAVLMVVAANQTSRSAVARALGLINGCNILGIVLNRFEPSHSQRTSYGYGEGRHRPEPSPLV